MMKCFVLYVDDDGTTGNGSNKNSPSMASGGSGTGSNHDDTTSTGTTNTTLSSSDTGASNNHTDSSPTATDTSQPSHNNNLPTIEQDATEEEAVEGIGNHLVNEPHQYGNSTHSHPHIQPFHQDEPTVQVSAVVRFTYLIIFLP